MKFIILMIVASVAGFCIATPLEYVAPEFMQSYYDAYSFNYLNAAASGRGNTSVGVVGEIQDAVANPASFQPNRSHSYLELIFKPPVAEMNELEFTENNYHQYTPVGIVGIGLTPIKGNNLGLLYAIPRSLKYHQYTRDTKSGKTITRYPALLEHQITLTYSRILFAKLTAGVNLSTHIYRNSNYRKYYNWDKLHTTNAALRIQPGLLWKSDLWSIGFSYKSKMTQSFDMSLGEKYEVTIPDEYASGISLKLFRFTLFSDIEFIRCSSQSEKFDDKIRWKAGFEKQRGNVIWRLGYLDNPVVFEGQYAIPMSNNPSPDSNPLLDYGKIGNTDQSFITAGFSWILGIADIHVALMKDFKGNSNMTQVYSGLSLDLGTFGGVLGDVRSKIIGNDEIIIED